MSFRPRISILTALLLMTILGMTIVMSHMWRQSARMRRQLQAMRVEVGALDIEDANKLYGIEVKEAGSYRWNWRVWLPPGHDYWFCASLKVPSKGITNRQFETFVGIGGQEINIHVQLVLNENGKRTIYVKCPAADCPVFEVDDAKWVNGDAQIGMDVAGRKTQVSSSIGEPLVLLRLSEVAAKPGPTDGLLLWISDARKP